MPGPWTDFNRVIPDARLAPLLADFPPELFGERLYRSILWVDAYVLQLSLVVLEDLGATAALATPTSAAALRGVLGLVPTFDPQLSWLLDRVATAGLLTIDAHADARVYHREISWPAPAPEQLATEGLAIDAGNQPTIALLDAAAAVWLRIAHGEVTGEDALLSPDAIGLWLDYFDNTNVLYAVNNRAAAIVAASRLADSERFSVLELGAGAGSGTEALLQELDRRGLLDRMKSYLITEPSAFLRRRGERKLKAGFLQLPLRFAALDIDRPWVEQEIEGDRFDLIYGVNVLHVAKDLSFSLRAARAALAPGGSLVAGECLRPFPAQSVYIEFVFQLLDSFRSVIIDPDRRPRPGFLTPEEWQRSLTEAGFAAVDLRPDHLRTREVFPHLYVAAVCGQ